ncbi:MAG TPA: methyltransferase domain-containing protein [Verrucomicrobiae bacterium]|nr:methyltransferase domain-containing protein [Verrucomicrobiae bacterium]
MKESAFLLDDSYARDRAETLRNRERLSANHNLLYWYRRLYRDQFADLPAPPEQLSILEIGSGTSPLFQFYPNVRTSDVLPLDYLDYSFDCHDIDQFKAIPDASLDVLTLTNVLHHLKQPIIFLKRAAAKLKPGGRVIATEPFFSLLSSPIFNYLHHEPVDFSIGEPELSEVLGPLRSANIALPWLIFFKRSKWRDQLRETFEFDTKSYQPFSFISYMATGGISRCLPIPSIIYRILFDIDLAASRALPKVFASFFTITLTRK